MGLREEKKKETRKMISNLATLLFAERGYHNVTTTEIAQLAKVSKPTLFKYFPTKESLVFDEDFAVEAILVDSVRNRKDRSVRAALLETGLSIMDAVMKEGNDNYKIFTKLIESTPELAAYSKLMWIRHEGSLAKAIRKETGIPALEAKAIAHFALDAYSRAAGAKHPKSALRDLFQILERGWLY